MKPIIGGKDKNRHWDKKAPCHGRKDGKTAVIGAIAAKGNVVCQIIESADRDHAQQVRAQTVMSASPWSPPMKPMAIIG